MVSWLNALPMGYPLVSLVSPFFPNSKTPPPNPTFLAEGYSSNVLHFYSGNPLRFFNSSTICVCWTFLKHMKLCNFRNLLSLLPITLA